MSVPELIPGTHPLEIFFFVLSFVPTVMVVVLVLLFYRASLHVGRAKIGIILIACSALAPWLLRIGFSFSNWQLYWQLYEQHAELIYYIILSSPSIALTIVGLALYIGSRKVFWKANRDQRVRVLLMIFGSILIILGGFLSWWTYSVASYFASKPPDSPLGVVLTTYSPYFIMLISWVISGTILLVDARKLQAFDVLD